MKNCCEYENKEIDGEKGWERLFKKG